MKTIYSLFLVVLGVFSLISTPVLAQAAYIHGSGWTVSSTFFTPNTLPGDPPPAVTPAPEAEDPSVDEAWDRVWTPIQDVTGVGRPTAESYIETSTDRFISDSDEMMGNARAWSVIIGDLGLGHVAKDVAKDWFVFTTTDVPQKLAQ